MTPLETLIVFVGIPLVICAVTALLVYGTSGRRAPRYRPGRPFDVAPVWFVGAASDAAGGHTQERRLGGAVLEGTPEPASLTQGTSSAGPEDVAAARTPAASARATPVPAATAATGPKGGARGTW